MMRPTATRGPRGLALMEALIALLLLSFAALGYAGLQLRGLGANSSAAWRGKASLLAYEMADRMRANRAGLSAGHYKSLVVVQAPSCGDTSACKPPDMAQLDYSQWALALEQGLPGGDGVVCLDSTPDDGTVGQPACDGGGNMLAVKVFWREKGEDARVVLSVRP